MVCEGLQKVSSVCCMLLVADTAAALATRVRLRWARQPVVATCRTHRPPTRQSWRGGGVGGGGAQWHHTAGRHLNAIGADFWGTSVADDMNN